jgi:hypothetical protein
MRVVVGPRRAWDFYEVPRGFVNIPSGESNIPSFVFFFCWGTTYTKVVGATIKLIYFQFLPIQTNIAMMLEMLLAKMRHQFLSFF